MKPEEKYTNLYMLVLSPLVIGAVVWAIAGLSPGRIGAGVIILAILTVLSSCFLRIQLPRIDTHFTISDALLILSILLYGGEVTLLIAVVETALASISIRRQGSKLKTKAIFMNVMIAALGVFVATHAVSLIFGSSQRVLERDDFTSFLWLIAVMAGSLFAVNSVGVSIYSALRSNRPLWRVWSQNCLDAILMYLAGGILAAFIYKALETIDLILFGAVAAFFGIVYLTFRHFVDDVKKSVEKASQAERQRAEDAESHVHELQHYVAQLEHSGEALKESHERFRHAAYHDALTGLPNRNYFIDRLKELLRDCRDRSETNFAILLIDLNRFKTINDSLGHSMGDRLIKSVAVRIAQLVREDDMVARFSGDKFGIILCGLLRKDEATAFAERLARRVADPYTLDGRQVFTAVKVGIAFGNSKYGEAEDILRDADIAMYCAKDNNEDLVIFDQKMHIRAVTRMQLETDLRSAIENEEIELYYQPIIRLDTATLVGFEALARWNHPQRGLVPPGEFIPIGENTGLIVPMTVKILNSACSQVVKWQQRITNGNPLSVAVNISGRHFANPDLVDQINDVLKSSKIEPASLKLELTESAVMENADLAILMLKQIKETGVQISIDDFGTGYSSLSYLHRFPIDLLKVDQSFVSAMESNSENGEIVRTVIALAKALKLKVVAEGIESIHQFHQLRILGCEYGQGYLFAKALPARDIENLLDDNNRWQNILPMREFEIVPPKPDMSEILLTQ